jgi:toxin ParE1/3/4
MRVTFSTAARADLADVYDYIAEDNPRRADSFTGQLVDACVAIGHLPDGTPVLARYRSAGIRRRIHGRYLIFFRIAPDEVEILRIVHGKRDVVRLLDEIADR